ncbi:hypothetical protein ACFYYS_18515 [Streptomyces sp. NPDC002120]|uniref:hypothetical protein n=1 Tax=Streptomyces sp. NPDC002120 TaxID=3364631 RepID=UPI0036761BCF
MEFVITGATPSLEADLRAALARHHPVAGFLQIETRRPWTPGLAGWLIGELPDRTRLFVAAVVEAQGIPDPRGGAYAGHQMNSLSRAVSRGQRKGCLPEDMASPVRPLRRASSSWSHQGYTMLPADVRAFKEAFASLST